MYGGWGRREGRPMDNFIPSENPSGVEQLKRSAVIATQNVARLRQQLERHVKQTRHQDHQWGHPDARWHPVLRLARPGRQEV
jgi:hypothetical protein